MPSFEPLQRLERTVRQRSEVAARIIGEEAVVITPGDSRVHELDPVATFVWQLCDGERTGWHLVDEVVASFDVDRDRAARDLDGLLHTLSEKGLVELLRVA